MNSQPGALALKNLTRRGLRVRPHPEPDQLPVYFRPSPWRGGCGISSFQQHYPPHPLRPSETRGGEDREGAQWMSRSAWGTEGTSWGPR